MLGVFEDLSNHELKKKKHVYDAKGQTKEYIIYHISLICNHLEVYFSCRSTERSIKVMGKPWLFWNAKTLIQNKKHTASATLKDSGSQTVPDSTGSVKKTVRKRQRGDFLRMLWISEYLKKRIRRRRSLRGSGQHFKIHLHLGVWTHRHSHKCSCSCILCGAQYCRGADLNSTSFHRANCEHSL